MTNAFLLCDLFENLRKFMKQTEKEALIYIDSLFGVFKY